MGLISKKSLSKKLRQAQTTFVRRAPRIVASMTNEAVTYFKGNVFDRKGIDVQPKTVNGGRWKNRKQPDPGRQLLVQSGALRRSINGRHRGALGIISTDIPYAQYHQTGTSKMPMRKFMGESDHLNRSFRKRIEDELTKAFENV